jgi:formylglycine-generating enzyme required for sulfatase activity
VAGSYNQGVNCPIFDVTWGDAARFCNWLQNGQPTGPEGSGTTETGAYTLSGATADSALIAVTRNSGASYFIPTENEWYKAAYYNPGAGAYWTYPTQSNIAPGNTLPDPGNSANYWNGSYTDPTNYLTPVGAFSASPGPYGTFDMGGDVSQWNETISTTVNSDRDLRGGSWTGASPGSWYHSFGFPTLVEPDIGFRVASVPEPGSVGMLIMIALTTLPFWKRQHA